MPVRKGSARTRARRGTQRQSRCSQAPPGTEESDAGLRALLLQESGGGAEFLLPVQPGDLGRAAAAVAAAAEIAFQSGDIMLGQGACQAGQHPGGTAFFFAERLGDKQCEGSGPLRRQEQAAVELSRSAGDKAALFSYGHFWHQDCAGSRRLLR